MSEERLNYYKEWIKENEEIVVDSSIFEELVNEIEKLDNIIKEVRELCEPFVEWGECTINGKILKQIVDILDKGE